MFSLCISSDYSGITHLSYLLGIFSYGYNTIANCCSIQSDGGTTRTITSANITPDFSPDRPSPTNTYANDAENSIADDASSSLSGLDDTSAASNNTSPMLDDWVSASGRDSTAISEHMYAAHQLEVDDD